MSTQPSRPVLTPNAPSVRRRCGLHLAVRLLGLSLSAAALGCEGTSICITCKERDTGMTGGEIDGDPPAPTGGEAGQGGSGGAGGDGGDSGEQVEDCRRRDGGEICNGEDDDCDGKTDEDFDLQRDLRHCGACNATCAADNAEASCERGECRIGACQLGYKDRDDEIGCEYRCPVFPTRPEDCNGIDDDCDGAIDETLGDPPENLCRVIADTPCANTEAVCRTNNGRTFWACDYGDDVEFDPRVANGIVAEESQCDGHDGDCDGEVDEPWGVGDACEDDAHGACRGLRACDPQDPTQVVCSFSHLNGADPDAEEICNGFDDNCDGQVDNGVVDDLVQVQSDGLSFYIYRHEASRPDATAESGGTRNDRACGRAGVIPWTFVTFDAAAAACAAANKRLCTESEWRAACESAQSRFPYGNSYEPQTCNGADHGPSVDPGEPSTLLPTGSLPSCQSTAGALDLSGNVKEWTDDLRDTTSDGTPIYVVRGGSYESPELGLGCQTDLARAAAFPGQAGIGFRCCADSPD